jgi:hypothetical protein
MSMLITHKENGYKTVKKTVTIFSLLRIGKKTCKTSVCKHLVAKADSCRFAGFYFDKGKVSTAPAKVP